MERLDRVLAIQRSSTDAAGREWVAASVELWSVSLRIHLYCLGVPQPKSPEDVRALTLEWRVATDDGERVAAGASAGWYSGVWSVALVVVGLEHVVGVRGYSSRDAHAERVVAIDF